MSTAKSKQEDKDKTGVSYCGFEEHGRICPPPEFLQKLSLPHRGDWHQHPILSWRKMVAIVVLFLRGAASCPGWPFPDDRSWRRLCPAFRFRSDLITGHGAVSRRCSLAVANAGAMFNSF